MLCCELVTEAGSNFGRRSWARFRSFPLQQTSCFEIAFSFRWPNRSISVHACCHTPPLSRARHLVLCIGPILLVASVRQNARKVLPTRQYTDSCAVCLVFCTPSLLGDFRPCGRTESKVDWHDCVLKRRPIELSDWVSLDGLNGVQNSCTIKGLDGGPCNAWARDTFSSCCCLSAMPVVSLAAFQLLTSPPVHYHLVIFPSCSMDWCGASSLFATHSAPFYPLIRLRIHIRLYNLHTMAERPIASTCFLFASLPPSGLRSFTHSREQHCHSLLRTHVVGPK
ncbi:unnamed protein product [Protopolystoma xenopodis]|uniref:Uncharacterized protein n=1 Tax=Protopolystoma xenopodis TaxID=117903 RepID=A0A448WR58_9PLAT|nr:unnamed protein product [Protopolystoma xenopodis]